MVCRQASNLGYLPPVPDYSVCEPANDNQAPAEAHEWLASVLGIFSCFGMQVLWSSYLLWQLQS